MSFSRVLKTVLCGIGLLSAAACTKHLAGDHQEEQKVAAKTIEEALREHTAEWMSLPGVMGVAIGEFKGKPCIRVLVVEKTEKLAEAFPAQVEGFPVIVEETGQFRARTSE